MAKKSSINQARYDKTHISQITLKLHKLNDKDILEAIEDLICSSEKMSKQGAIKILLRKAIHK